MLRQSVLKLDKYLKKNARLKYIPEAIAQRLRWSQGIVRYLTMGACLSEAQALLWGTKTIAISHLGGRLPGDE